MAVLRAREAKKNKTAEAHEARPLCRRAGNYREILVPAETIQVILAHAIDLNCEVLPVFDRQTEA